MGFNVLSKPSPIQPFLSSLPPNPLDHSSVPFCFESLEHCLPKNRLFLTNVRDWLLPRILIQMGQFHLAALVAMSTSPALHVGTAPYMKCKLVQCVDRTGSRNWPHIISHSWRHADDMHLTPSGIIWPSTHQRPSFGNLFMMALWMN